MSPAAFIVWRDRDRRYLPALIVLVFLLAALLTVFYVVFSVIRVSGPSMLPTLEDGDRVLVTRGYGTPEAGDVVSFFAVDGSGSVIRVVKRVIAVPGDSVEIIGDAAYVNGELSSAAPTAIVGEGTAQIGPFVVPADSVYVLGDNRPVSFDSRFMGPIPLDSVIGEGVAVILPPWRAGRIDE